MDETAKRHGELLTHLGPKAIPGYERDESVAREQVRAQTFGGSDSQRLRGTTAYHEASNDLRVPGSERFIAMDAARDAPALKGKGKDQEHKGKGQLKGKSQDYDKGKGT